MNVNNEQFRSGKHLDLNVRDVLPDFDATLDDAAVQPSDTAATPAPDSKVAMR